MNNKPLSGHKATDRVEQVYGIWYYFFAPQ